MATVTTAIRNRLESLVSQLTPASDSTTPTEPALSTPTTSASPTTKMPDQTLAGKVAIVSGSNSGIGASIVRELASRGAKTVVNYPFPQLKTSADTLVSSLPTESISVEADLSTIEGPQALVDATVAKYGKIDILINSAGLAINKPFEEQDINDWNTLVNLNGRGTFFLTQAVLPHLNRNSRIVNIISISARAPPPNQTVYSGTKGMIESFTRCWARELPPKYGCTVNAVSPGPTKTEGFAAAGPEMMKILQPTIDSTPAEKRMGEPDEIAYAVAFLCEERARWVNGEHMFVCGGLFIQ